MLIDHSYDRVIKTRRAVYSYIEIFIAVEMVCLLARTIYRAGPTA